MAMTWEDYKDQVFTDAKEELETELESYSSYYDDFSQVFDALQLCDNVTGNGSGSYTFNTWQAMDNLSELVWDADFIELFDNCGYEGIPMDMGPESVDVIARCLALDELYWELEEHYGQLLADMTH